jgi:hypothetical protein
MASPSEIINEKCRRMELLWNAKRLKEMVTTMYVPDAWLSDNTNFRKGHDQILNALENYNVPQFEFTVVERLTLSDDCIVETSTYESDGRNGYRHITWKKMDGDWKIICDLWS